ncbi:hypothetical protein AG1IA_03094 [Rhizoctonia solani AG-1 IA]|uniref:Uncharacterized protein n=1 Tax=Thanatephorus cucumeris (strain AG1-IA) TaxID=983506 RepID=L8X1A9_THACA|nr:hypothetical protein AG1IA_03094 [Rhizoctonia solani AG-1 IA]
MLGLMPTHDAYRELMTCGIKICIELAPLKGHVTWEINSRTIRTQATQMIQSNKPLPADARRIRTIIWSGPLLVVTSCEFGKSRCHEVSPLTRRYELIDVLYNRLVLGKERRTVEVEVQKNPHARLGDNAFMRKYPEDNPINTNSSS